MWIRTVFGANVQYSIARIQMNVNGNAVTPSPNYIDTSDLSDARHYKSANMIASTTLGDNIGKLDIGITFSCTGTVRLARLDNITVNYTRALSLDGAQLAFRTDRGFAPRCQWQYPHMGYHIAGSGSARRLHRRRRQSMLHTYILWRKEYVAWNADAEFPDSGICRHNSQSEPPRRGDTRHGHIHIAAMEGKSRATGRHTPRGPQNLKVLVVNAEQVYNEFSSGTPDIGAFRRMLKMMWDRGRESANPATGSDSKLQYALMFGRAFYDHRGITPEGRSYLNSILPQWQSIDGETDNVSYTTEDYLAFLRDDSGAYPGQDYHCIGVGRIPVNNANEAKVILEKIRNYVRDSRKTTGKTAICSVPTTETTPNTSHRWKIPNRC